MYGMIGTIRAESAEVAIDVLGPESTGGGAVNLSEWKSLSSTTIFLPPWSQRESDDIKKVRIGICSPN